MQAKNSLGKPRQIFPGLFAAGAHDEGANIFGIPGDIRIVASLDLFIKTAV